MPGRATTTFVFASALLGFAGGIPLHAQSAEHPTSAVESGPLLAAGKEIFLERCASCHNEGGDKPLKTGAPLNERGLSAEVIAKAVNGRLRDRAEDERRAVTLYISSLMKSKNPENNALPKP
jgi:mono/diheme cytochrome c family protein